MVADNKRLYFIDAMRAWAILMMLQGHFIDGLLDPIFRDPSSMVYSTWKYFRGITAPVFFTVSGFIFTYLLLRAPRQGTENPRIRKGLKRGVQLILIGYLLRTNIFGLLSGVIYPSFFLVDVLHCIGISILVIIGFYALSSRWGPKAFPGILLGFGLLLFLFEPVYMSWELAWMPTAVANYLTKANGSVFTVIPWVGYATLGGFLSVAFHKYRKDRFLYVKSILSSLAVGALLIWYSSPLFEWLGQQTGVGLFNQIMENNYLFIRLGDVLVVFAVFMILRGLMRQEMFLKIGQNTLSIYVIHFIILYGSFTGLGLYSYFKLSLSPAIAIAGALFFMGLCSWSALTYDKYEPLIKAKAGYLGRSGMVLLNNTVATLLRNARAQVLRIAKFLKSAQSR